MLPNIPEGLLYLPGALTELKARSEGQAIVLHVSPSNLRAAQVAKTLADAAGASLVITSARIPSITNGATHWQLLYLDKDTFTDTNGPRGTSALADEMRVVLAAGVPIMLVHDCDPMSKFSCTFDHFIGSQKGSGDEREPLTPYAHSSSTIPSARLPPNTTFPSCSVDAKRSRPVVLAHLVRI